MTYIRNKFKLQEADSSCEFEANLAYVASCNTAESIEIMFQERQRRKREKEPALYVSAIWHLLKSYRKINLEV